MSLDTPGQMLIEEWAYNMTPGEGIQAGVIPEPATHALGFGALALVAAALRRNLRRSRL